MSRSEEVDAYIAAAPEYARPILEKIRKAMHAGCKEMKESMKWSAPAFEHHGIVAGMSTTKNYVRFGLWKAMCIDDPQELFERAGNTDVGILKVAKASELPTATVLRDYVRRAAAFNESSAGAPKKKASAPRKSARVPAVPDDLAAALKRSAKARKTFEGFSNSHKKEYLEWILEAKREDTRKKRVAQAIDWMAEGKPRNWKYMKEWR